VISVDFARGARAAGWTLVVLLGGSVSQAQDFDGHFSALFSVMPDVSPSSGRQSVVELRTRLFAEGLFVPAESWRIRAGVFVDALLADRRPLMTGTTATAAIARPAELYVEFRGASFDVRAGMSRIVWGRLDEFQPTDVVNPVDLSRFMLEGRSEARLPVGVVRGRLFLPASTTVEAIIVPVFRAGRFDQLDEDTSPFLLAPPGVRERHDPGTSWRNVQGGGRVTSTIGRVDWGVSAWRGFEHFPAYVPLTFAPDPLALVLPRFAEVFPRFTMVGADFETVRGPWGLRGELAWFDSATPRSFEGGIGADRRAGNYRVALNAVISRAEDTDVTLVGWAERSFARETRSVRLLAVYDPSDDTSFVRGITSWNVRDNVSLEASAGWFPPSREVGTRLSAANTGDSTAVPRSGIDVLSLLSRRDFVYTRLRIHF
jgi:hypothetical protein